MALLTSIGALAFSGIAASTPANDAASAVAQTTLSEADASLEVSAQGRRGGSVSFGRTGGGRQGGNVGRMGRQGSGVHTGRGGRQGTNITGGRQGTNITGGRQGTRIGTMRYGTRIGYYGRVGRYGYRYGRIGRVGFVPVPVPLPMGPGPALAPRLVAPPCPVCPVQACLIAVYADPNLTGAVLETADNQPRLDLNGWQNQISSIMVKSGTWDFFPDVEYRSGPPLRLAPGSYGLLEPQWTKRIGSFMCVR
jgi:hypothetical protein